MSEILEEQIRDLVPHLRHSPGCIDHSQPFEWCPCGLETLLGELRRMLGTEIVRCEGCGVYAITPDGTEDWAWRENPLEPFCHGCALASMNAQRKSERERRRWWPQFRHRRR